MSTIKLNQLTGEIELKGPESFIKANFDKIEDLLTESLGKQEMAAQRETKLDAESLASTRKTIARAETDANREEKSFKPESPRLARIDRLPLRKYIRKVGTPGHERTVVEIAKQTPKEAEITLESLREKFGLNRSKLAETMRDIRQGGEFRRVVNGSCVWSRD